MDGEGAHPGGKQLLAVGEGAGIRKKRCVEIIEEVEETAGRMLGRYLKEQGIRM